MSAAFTSRLSYLAIQGELSGLQRAVWEAIRDWPGEVGPSIQELAAHLGRKECSICGRLNELREAEAIEDGPMKMGACGVQVKSYRAVIWSAPTNETDQMMLL